ncbi:hypothetical protein B0H11DRAFT_1855349 [Mycena galericulata]|nr:hypothetical protein B0H11DRAFT_1855349 [Mycena galericulata]
MFRNQRETQRLDIVSADFVFSEDRSQVSCRACSVGVPVQLQAWMAVKSGTKHLQYAAHKRAVERVDEARVLAEMLQRERQGESSASGLRDVAFAPQQIHGPITVGAAGSSNHRSEEEIEMWGNYNAHGANFDAGDDEADPQPQYERLRAEAEVFGLRNAEVVAKRLGFGGTDVDEEILAEEEEEDFFSEIMRNAEPEQAEIRSDVPPSSSEWFPYPTKMMFLLDTLDNLPRLRVSNSLMRVFLWVLKEAQCKDVPSFDHFRKIQKTIRSDCGIPSIPCKSAFGNVFFMNDPRAIIAQDWTNPTTRRLIHVYPEIPEDGVIREIWHAQKWRKNMDLDALSPMYDAQGTHYYVNEIAQLKNGQFVVPIRWVRFRGKVYADAFTVTVNKDNEASVCDETTQLISASDLAHNYLDLEHRKEIPNWSPAAIAAGHPARMPNPKREIAGGHPLYHSIVDYFGDDVSGNRSKSWNKHWNAYMTHRNLPRKLLQQEFHTHFVSTSPNASISEQYREFKSTVESTHTNPIQVQDDDGNTTCICIYVNAAPFDNPMQSEVSAHIGGKGNHFCRKCEVGGTQKEKSTNEGYHALFEAGVPRTKDKILAELENQVKMACSGVNKHVKDSQTHTGVKDMYTQYWIDHLLARFKEMKTNEPNRSEKEIEAELIQWALENRDKIYSAFLTTKGFDPTKDTPVEILHTILLGVVKYIWHISHTPWTAEKKKLYAVRLQSTDTDGLSIHAIRANYIMQYAGSLIGRQFKTIAQTNIFHIHGLVTDHQFLAWKATGELAALLWVPEIRDINEYRRDLIVAVANVLDVFSMIDPSKIMTKIKYHLLAHIGDDALEFGPLVGIATEVFECFNGVFRYCSIFSNHLAPSRDIALQLGDQEGFKHRLTGGWWLSSTDNVWQRAGSGVRHFMGAHPVLQKLLGWSEPKSVLKHGETKLAPLKRGQKTHSVHSLKSTTAARAVNFGMYPADSDWHKCSSVVGESLDECFVESWIFAQSATDSTAVISGRIAEILRNTGSRNPILVLELFQVLSVRDNHYGMPVLVRRDGETIFTIIPCKNVKFKVNVQHDCHTAKCEATGERAVMQERVESDKTETFIVHKPLDRFIINSHAFHNAHLLRATLPRTLLAPVPFFDDRREKHNEFAATLRNSMASKAAKREATAAGKKKATRKRKAPPRDDSDDGNEETARPAPAKRRRRSSLPEEGGLVAGRAKRVITRTKRAEAADESDGIEHDLGDESREENSD